MIAIVLALVSAAGLAVGAFGDRWLARPDNGFSSASGLRRSAGMGLRIYEKCTNECISMTNFELVDAIEAEIAHVKELNKKLPAKEQLALPRPVWHGFPVVGVIAFVFALIGAAGLLVGAGIAMAGKRPSLPIMPTTIGVLGLALGIINGCIFIATKPDLDEQLVVGWSFIVFGFAAVLGLAAVFPLNRAIRPIDAELGEAASTMSWGGSRDDLP